MGEISQSIQKLDLFQCLIKYVKFDCVPILKPDIFHAMGSGKKYPASIGLLLLG
jgi:hypothetical protein